MRIFREPIELGPWVSLALVVAMAMIMVTNLSMLSILQQFSLSPPLQESLVQNQNMTKS